MIWRPNLLVDLTVMRTFVGKDLPLTPVRHLNDIAFIAEIGKEYQCVIFANDGASLFGKELAQREKIVAQARLDGSFVLRPRSGENPEGGNFD